MSRSGSCLLLAMLIALPLPAFAYIDPGTGSALIQGLIAGIAAIGVTMKLYWHRLVAFFGRKPDIQEATDPDNAESSNTPK